LSNILIFYVIFVNNTSFLESCQKFGVVFVFGLGELGFEFGFHVLRGDLLAGFQEVFRFFGGGEEPVGDMGKVRDQGLVVWRLKVKGG